MAVPIPPSGLICSEHMARFLDTKDLYHYIDLAIKALKRQEFDSIAFRGMSGAVSAPIIALALKKNLILVRKPEDRTHSQYRVEGFNASRRYVIVDDFISTGETARAIRDSIYNFAHHAKCIGVLPIQRLDKEEINRLELKNLPYPLSRIPKKGSVAAK